MKGKPQAALSLDLDNLWSYMRIHGDAGWQGFPSYLDTVVPRFLDFLEKRDLTITVFVVGKDATIRANMSALRAIVEAGHEIGNHSHMHEPWLHRYPMVQLEDEIGTAHDAIANATGVNPIGFRGPGFSFTPALIQVLHDRGYLYDTTTLPTFIGPLARWYYFRGSDLDARQAEEREALFGAFSDGFRPNRPYRWEWSDGAMLELPVTTFPLMKTPFHFSYLLYIGGVSPRLADAYFAAAMAACRMSRLGPTMLLHPLDFLDASDAPELAFFPAMDIEADTKIRLLGACIDRFVDRFEVGTVHAYAETLGPLTRARPVR